MVRDEAIHPRWVLRTDERRSRRYSGDKVVRWIARPTLTKGRAKGDDLPMNGQDVSVPAEQVRPSGTVRLRIVSDN